MADASKKVNIGITTTADTSGADKAAKAINSVAYSTGQTADKTKVASFAFYDLDEALQKSAASTIKLKRNQQEVDIEFVKAKQLARELGDSYSSTSSKVVKGSGNMAFAVGNVGAQIQDIAVQAQSGTSAITILAQQGPQLLSGFGPQGAIAGAVLALGALILSSMIKSTEAAKKAAQDAWEAADEFAKKTEAAYKAAGGEAADNFIAKSLQIADLTRQSADQEIDLANQQRERIKAQGELIKSQEDLAIASVKYLEATGQIEDAEKRITEIQTASREAQKQSAVADIEASTKAAEIKYKTAQTLYEDAKNEKARIQEEVDALQQRQQSLNREANIFRTADRAAVADGAQKAGYQSADTSRVENQLAQLESAIATLQKESKKAPEKIDKALTNIYATAQEFDNAQRSAAAQIQELETKFNVTESTQALNTGVATLTEGVRTLKEDVAKLEPVNAQQQEAKNTIQAALADGKLTADEMLKVGAALQVLLGTIKAGQEGNVTTIQEMQKVMNSLIASNNALVAEATRQAGIIKTLPIVAR